MFARLHLRRSSIAALLVAIAMIATMSTAFAARGGNGNGKGGGGGSGGREYTLVHQNETLLLSYAGDPAATNTNGIVGRVVVTVPPASSGEAASVHIVGLSGLATNTYYVYLNQGTTWNMLATFAYVYGSENEFSAAIPDGYTNFGLYIMGPKEYGQAPVPGSAGNLLLGATGIKVTAAGSGGGSGGGGHMYTFSTKYQALNCYMPAGSENVNGIQARVVVSVSPSEGAVMHVIGFGGVVYTGTTPLPVEGNTLTCPTGVPAAAHYYVYFHTTTGYVAATPAGASSNELVYSGSETEFSAPIPKNTSQFSVVITGAPDGVFPLMETGTVKVTGSGSGGNGGGGGGGR